MSIFSRVSILHSVRRKHSREVTMPYQDEYVEVACPECGGAGFFGSGPYVDPCGCCGGTGVLLTDKPLDVRKRESAA